MRDPGLDDLVLRAVQQGVAHARRAYRADDELFDMLTERPRLQWRENGMPELHLTRVGGPPDYKKLFWPGLYGVGGLAKRQEETDGWRASFRAVVDYVRSRDDLRTRFLPRYREDVEGAESFLESMVNFFIESIIDRYLHTCQGAAFSYECFRAVYQPLEIGYFAEVVPLDVWTPILFLRFEEDEIVLDGKTAIQRMSDGFHLARADVKAYAPGVHESVMACATHALVLKSYELKMTSHWSASETISSALAYPIEKIDVFFGALRTVSGLDTGYAQLLVNPKGWAYNYEADYPAIIGTSIRKYPAWFENFRWLEEVPVLSADLVDQLRDFYPKLSAATAAGENRRISLALRKLNSCLLREDEDDAVLDATTAFEILLSDDNRDEITYKLAIRLAALSALGLGERLDPVDVYRKTKHIYGFRSSLVHGSVKQADKKRQIAVSETDKIPTLRMAVTYLRMAIRVLVENPIYLDTSAIDENLLLKRGVPDDFCVKKKLEQALKEADDGEVISHEEAKKELRIVSGEPNI